MSNFFPVQLYESTANAFECESPIVLKDRYTRVKY